MSWVKELQEGGLYLLVVEGEAFCSPMVSSQCFGEPVPLDCDLHECFSAFSPHVGGTGWLEWVAVK